MSATLAHLHLATRRAVWLLELEIGGEVWRVATEAVEVVDADGLVFAYRSGLADLEVEVVASGATESVVVRLSTGDDWAAMAMNGQLRERARAVLRRWWIGTALERATTYLVGYASDIEYGATHEPLTATLATDAVELSATLPGPQHVIDGSTWPVSAVTGTHIPEQSEGHPYGVIVGYPGDVGVTPYTTGAGDPLPKPAFPIVLAQWNTTSRGSTTGIVASHRIAATTITILQVDAVSTVTGIPAFADASIIETTDNLGARVSAIGWDGTAITHTIDAEFWGGLTKASGGGMVDRDGLTLRGLGDVIRELMIRWAPGVRFDLAGHEAQAPYLNRFMVDAVWNESAPVLAIVRDLVALLPVREARTERGVFWEWLDPSPSHTDSVGHLSADAGGLVRGSQVRTIDGTIENEITIEYQGSIYERGASYGRTIITARPGVVSVPATGTGTDPRVLGDARCSRSQSLYGVRPSTYQVPWTWDPATATLVGRTIAARLALPSRVVSYTGTGEHEALSPGSIVTLTDSEISLSQVLARVASMTVGMGPPVLTMEILPSLTAETSV